MHLDIVKAHGTANDFVIVEDLDDVLDLTARSVAALCDRHRGVGADGLIRIAPAGAGGVFMDYRNADGSTAQMCGNGIRCLAKYCFDRGILAGSEATIETLAGPRAVTVHRGPDGRVDRVEVDMGEPVFTPARVPVHAAGDRALALDVDVDGTAHTVAALSMGNPHAVLFVDDVEGAPVARVGPEIASSGLYPEGANVGFARVDAPDRIVLRVWERGSGETRACGTAACAAVVAAAETGRSVRAVTVALPGGELRVDYGTSVRMSGPAVEVFTARVDLAALAVPADPVAAG